MTPAEKVRLFVEAHREELEFLEREGIPYAGALLRLAGAV